LSLPQRCRWVFWGKPSLVDPQTGVLFAVGFGSRLRQSASAPSGIVMRLPPDVLAGAAPDQALPEGMTPAEGVDALMRALAADLPQVLVSPQDPIALLERLHGLVAKGVLTQAEFDAKKAELLSKIR